MDKWFHPTLYNGCNYLSMLGLKLNHVSKRGPWVDSCYSITHTLQGLKCTYISWDIMYIHLYFCTQHCKKFTWKLLLMMSMCQTHAHFNPPDAPYDTGKIYVDSSDLWHQNHLAKLCWLENWWYCRNNQNKKYEICLIIHNSRPFICPNGKICGVTCVFDSYLCQWHVVCNILL